MTAVKKTETLFLAFAHVAGAFGLMYVSLLASYLTHFIAAFTFLKVFALFSFGLVGFGAIRKALKSHYRLNKVTWWTTSGVVMSMLLFMLYINASDNFSFLI